MRVGARHRDAAGLDRLAQRFERRARGTPAARRGRARRDAPSRSRPAWRGCRRRPAPAARPNDAARGTAARRISLPSGSRRRPSGSCSPQAPRPARAAAGCRAAAPPASTCRRRAARSSAGCGRRPPPPRARAWRVSWPLMSRGRAASRASRQAGACGGVGSAAAEVVDQGEQRGRRQHSRSSPAQAASPPWPPGRSCRAPTRRRAIAAGSTPATRCDRAVERQARPAPR